MDKATVEQGLARKNAQAVLVTLEQFSLKLHELAERLNTLNAALATIQHRLDDAEHALAMVRIARMGSGPTVKGA